jgi:hypothetical protein
MMEHVLNPERGIAKKRLMKEMHKHNFKYNNACTWDLETDIIYDEYKCECGLTELRPLIIENNDTIFDREKFTFEIIDIFSGYRFTDDLK